MIRILLIDDHIVFREGLEALISARRDMELAAQAGDYAQALEQVRNGTFDIAVVDLSLPGRDGLQLLDTLRSLVPRLPVLVLTAHTESEYAARALRAGANGFLTKDVDAAHLIEAIQRVAAGRTAVSPRVAESVAIELCRLTDRPSSHSVLSAREFKVFEMLANGDRVSAIARDLNLSLKTVSTYKTRVMRKMNLRNLSDLVRYASSAGLGKL